MAELEKNNFSGSYTYYNLLFLLRLTSCTLFKFSYFVLSSRTVGCKSLLHDHLHSFKVIPLYFEIRYTAITLRGFKLTVT